MGEEYEDLVVAMSHIRRASDILEELDGCLDDSQYLHDLANTLNERRLRLLGNGLERPFFVAELLAAEVTP